MLVIKHVVLSSSMPLNFAPLCLVSYVECGAAAPVPALQFVQASIDGWYVL